MNQAVLGSETMQHERLSVKPEPVKPRLATATPAFSLSGVGRGQVVSPPSQYYSLFEILLVMLMTSMPVIISERLWSAFSRSAPFTELL